jgi:tight adherence protein B
MTGAARALRGARLPWRGRLPGGAARRLRRLRAGSGDRQHAWLRSTIDRAVRHRMPAVAVAASSAAAFAWLVGGPVAAGIAGGYAGVGVMAACRRWRTRADATAVAAALDAVTALAADLRAGLAPATALAHALPAFEASTVDDVRRIAARVSAAWQVAEVAGVPLADLLDRLDTDAQGLLRVRAAAAAQAAGARATAWLLAGLPLAGIGLGYGMGTDPVHVLLRTPLGALCAGLAGASQMAGLAWSSRLVRAVAEVC